MYAFILILEAYEYLSICREIHVLCDYVWTG